MNQLSIRLNRSDTMDYRIYSIDGKLVREGIVGGLDSCCTYQWEGYNKQEVTYFSFPEKPISLYDLASATYLIEVVDRNGRRQVEKFIKSQE